jgi:S-adenosylmethionine hydrolase
VAPLISFLSDFGTRDPWVAICRGVILRLAPEVRLLDISHEVPAFDVAAGARTLAAVVPELPVGVVLAVVDPGVGTDRRGVGVRTVRGDLLVGPDNGLLLPAAEALGGVAAAHELTADRDRRQSGAATFHGRDVFAPAAAHLALGVDLAAFGAAVPAAALVRLAPPVAVVRDGLLLAPVVAIDAFGNVDLGATRGDLEIALGTVSGGERLLVGAGGGTVVPWGITFGDVAAGDALLYENSLGLVALAVREGRAADRLQLEVGAIVEVRRAP